MAKEDEYGVWSMTKEDEYGVWSMAKEDEYGVWSMEYGVWQRKTSMEYGVWSISGLLLVLVCRSVPQDPPRPIEDIVVVSVFYTLRRPCSANQRSRMCTWDLADQSAIASCIDTTCSACDK